MVPSLENNFNNTVTPQTKELLFKAYTQTYNAASSVKTSFVNLQQQAITSFEKLKDRISKSAIDPTIKRINDFCCDLERILNLAGCLPGVAVPSGLLRTTIGTAQTISGIAISILGEIGSYLAIKESKEASLVTKWNVIAKTGLEYTIHGCLNVVKGSVEASIGGYLFGIGNLLMLAPNVLNGREFRPFFAYGTLSNVGVASL